MKLNLEYYASKQGLSQELIAQAEGVNSNMTSIIDGSTPSLTGSLIDAWDRSYLYGTAAKAIHKQNKSVRIVDLFCGCGGFTEGVKQGLETSGFSAEVIAGLDIDEDALKLYSVNHKPNLAISQDVNSVVNYQLRRKSQDDYEIVNARYATRKLEVVECLVNGCDVLLAGPPCQGHSNLNNHSRRDDPRNSLYLSVAAFASLLQPSIVVIENVSTVIHDKTDVVYKTVSSLRNLGYSTEIITINGVKIGLPQTRKRHFLFASKNPIFRSSELLSAFEEFYPAPRPVSWCLELAPRIYDRDNTFYAPSYLSNDNYERVMWLLNNNEYDLPNRLRPVCHQKDHNYKSVYGRMHWDKPSGTITTGFHSPGRGRYVHPLEPRVITSCEAALIQGFPRTYRFYADNFMPSRYTHAKVIGDAVSPVMSRFFGIIISLNLMGAHMANQGNAIAA